MPLALALPLTAAMFVAWSWTAYCVAARLTGDAPPYVRLCATALVQLWLGVTLFHVTSALHLFRLAAALPLGAALVAAAQLTLGRDAAAHLGSDVAALVDGLGALFRRRQLGTALVAAGAALVVGARLLRGLVSPPLAWDALFIHAYRPAVWVQTGAFAIDRPPDQEVYAYYPHGGAVTWAWAMLPVHGDALLAPAAVWIWTLVLVGTYGLARTLGAPRGAAAIAALAVGSLPPAINVATSGYVDDAVLAPFLLTFVFVARAPASPRAGGDIVLALAGFSLSAASKLSGAPTLLFGAALASLIAWRARPRQLRALALGLVAALAVAGPIYGAIWHATGSPTYPLPLRLFGHTLHPGSDEFVAMMSGRLFGIVDGPGVLPEFLRVLVVPAAPPGFRSEYLGIGLGAPLVLLLGFDGAARRLRAPGVRLATLALLALALVPLVALLSPAFLAERTYWKYNSGRLLLPLPAALLVLGATVPGRLARLVLTLVALLGLAVSLPQGFSAPALAGMRALSPWLVGAALLPIALALLVRPRRRAAPAAVAGAFAALAVVGARLGPLRAELRHPIFAAMSAPDDPAFELHPLFPAYAAAAPLWQALDDGAPHRLAVTVGWDGVGHNLLRLPLLGAHLQNRLQYVPITRDGSIVDYRNLDVAAQADARAWLGRLVDADIDHVVALGPPPPETRWMDAAPELFTLVAHDAAGFNRLYRIDRARARAALSSAR